MRKTIRQQDVHGGDLLIWSHDPYSALSDFYLRVVREATRSKYAHLAIAWKCADAFHDELFAVEATMPKIRAHRVTDETEYYALPMGLPMTLEGKAFLMSKLGLPYGLMDAVRAGLGIVTKDDDQYQCAEFAHEYYTLYNLVLGTRKTPKAVIQAALCHTKERIYRVIP